MRFSLLRPIFELVDKARKEGPLQDWQKPPKLKPLPYFRLDHRLPHFKRDPKVLWASDIAQSFAEGTAEALKRGYWEIALLRARTAAGWEEKFCAKPGLYRELLLKVSELLGASPQTSPGAQP